MCQSYQEHISWEQPKYYKLLRNENLNPQKQCTSLAYWWVFVQTHVKIQEQINPCEQCFGHFVQFQLKLSNVTAPFFLRISSKLLAMFLSNLQQLSCFQPICACLIQHHLHDKFAVTYSEYFDSTSKWRQERSKLYNL